MSANGIYSCTREMMEGRADKDQVGSALYAVFLHSYTRCIADVCFFLLNPLVVVSPCTMSHCWPRRSGRSSQFLYSGAELETGPENSAGGRCLGLYLFLIVLGNKIPIL